LRWIGGVVSVTKSWPDSRFQKSAPRGKAPPGFHNPAKDFRPGGAQSARAGVLLLMAKYSPSIELLPWFATDDAIASALLGPERVAEFKQLVPLLEARGLPKVDQLMGGRYLPAVRAFFDHQYGLDRVGDPPLAPDGVEDFGKWKEKQKRPV
jgi:hypothetical protein